ncbi:MAG: sulfotransferase [Pseudomonadota bacterium]
MQDKETLRERIFFVGVGAMKSGTSWLSDYLTRHPEVYHSPIKEVNFFNQISPNQLEIEPSIFRLQRMTRILLDKEPEYPPSKFAYRKLQQLANLTRVTDIESYRGYFANSIGSEQTFGEFSPNYSALDETGFRKMLEVNGDVRILYIMRDPTDRVCSHIRHIWRIKPELGIEEAISNLGEDNEVYFRTDYGKTIDCLHKAFGTNRVMLIFYDNLFNENTISSVCNFLGVSYFSPEISKKVHTAKTRDIEDDQKLRIREMLSGIYVDMNQRFGKNLPSYWNR